MKAVRFSLLLLGLIASAHVASAQQSLSIGPVHRYTFNNVAGTVADGTLIADTVGTASGIIHGAGASFDGAGGLRLTGGASTSAAYLDLPNGLVSGALDQSPGYASATYEMWVTVNSNQSFSRILDFGSNDGGEQFTVGGSFSGTDGLFISASVGTNSTMRFERGGTVLAAGGASQDIANATTVGSLMHLVAVYDATAQVWRLYKNAVLVGTLPTLLGPDTLPDANVWLGRSNWSGDSNADITYREFRVYNYAISSQQILGDYQTGPGAVTSDAPSDAIYKFDESTGTTSSDTQGGKVVTLTGGASFVAGQFGNALSLNGTTGYGRVVNNASLNPASAMTIWAWVNPTDWNGNRVIVQKGVNGSQYRLLAQSGVLRFELANPTRAVTAPLPQTGTWSFVVATYDGAAMRLYVNGKKVGETAATGAISTTTDDLFVGTSSANAPASEHFAGIIDDLRIYSRAVTLVDLQNYIGYPSVAFTRPANNALAVTSVSSALRLTATVTGALQTGVQWTKVSGPGTVTFSQPNSLDSTAQFSQVGTYVLQLTDTNAVGTGMAQVKVGVKPAPDSNLALWMKFNETSGTTAADSSGNGTNATLVNAPTWTTGIFNNALTLNGSTQWATLPTGIVSSLNDFTVSTWVKLSSVSTYSRIFDFGTGTTKYMYLSPQGGTTVRFAITTSGGSGEQQINGTAALASGAWTHVAVTYTGTTGILYVNGVEVGRNSGMTLKPSSLGSTTLNYLGKSQYSDPYLAGSVDDFQIYRRALSASEIGAYAMQTIAPTVSCGTAPLVSSGVATTLNGSVISESGAILTSAWTKVSGAGTVTFGSSSSPTTSVKFSKSGAYLLRLTGVNASAEVSSDLTVNVSSNMNVYADWINWSYPNAADSSVAPTADPDNDGVSNLIEWALGMNPASADATAWTTGKAGLPVAGVWSDGTNTYLSLLVRRPIGRMDITYAAEATSDLASWSPAVQADVPTANGDGTETVIYRDTVPREQALRRLIRLKLVQP